MDNPFVERISAALAPLVEMTPEEVAENLSAPPNPEMGDYAFPCFRLAKTWRRKPNEIAAELAGKLKDSGWTAGVNTAGPYLNFAVSRAEFVEWVLRRVFEEKDRFGHSDEGAGKTLVVDFSSPNMCKHLGIYHVRNTMLGFSLCLLHRALGWRVVGINHLGDWGTPWGLLIAAYRRWGHDGLFEDDAVGKLQDLYVRANEEAKADEAFAEEGRLWFRKMEADDPEAMELWGRFRSASLNAFEQVYKVLRVKFEVLGGESLVRHDLDDLVRRMRESGLAVESDGALVVDLSDMKMPPMMLLKSDGGTRYETRDIATAEQRYEQFRFDRCLYVVGQDQTLYFRQLFETLKRMGHEWAGRLVHVSHGMTRIGGERMRTRTGGAVKLKDVLAEAIDRELEIVVEKNPDLAERSEVASQVDVARQVAVGSLIFHELKIEPKKNMDFDWEDVLRWEGDTGAYVQYTHARLRSILRKHGRPVTPEVDFGRLSTDEEYALVRKLESFGTDIRRAAERCEPFVIARYLLDLCAVLSSYYSKHRVLGNEDALTDARILLVDSVRQVVRNGLALLGIEAPEEM